MIQYLKSDLEFVMFCCYRGDEESVSRSVQSDAVRVLPLHSRGYGHPLRQGWAW